MQFVWKYLKGNLSALIFASVLSSLSGLGIIFIMRTFHQAVKKGIDDPILFFTTIAIGLLAFTLFGLFSEKILSKLSSNIILQMRMDFSQLIFKSEYEEVEGKKKELISSLVSDVNGMARIVEKIPGANRSLVISIAGIIYLIFISWQLTVVLILSFATAYLVIYRRNKLSYKFNMASRKSWDAVYNNIHDIIFGIKELSLNSDQKETFIEKYLKKSGEKEASNKIKLKFFNEATGKISESILIVGVCVMISMALIFETISVTSFAEFITLSLFVIGPLSSVSNFTKEMVPLKVITTHIEEIGLQLTNAKDDILDNPISIPETGQSIVLRNIKYAYNNNTEDHRFHLGPLSLEIPANKITLIYGSNGSGKTTLSKILAGLYKIKKGTFNYGNIEINPSNLQSFRNRISAVFADNHLFRNNEISDASIPKIKSLLKIFSIDDKVHIEGNDVINEGLSTGQSKRLALVLSMIADREIYIFDEWAANQDPQFKKAFYYELLPHLIKDGKTVILVTHDDQYFDIADHKIHLQDGKVIS